MRIYSAFDEETLQARRFVREWTTEGLLNAEQGARLEADTETALRRTNGFLRFVLFLFTACSAAAGVGLVFQLWSIHDRTVSAIMMFIFSTLSYGLAEYAVARAHFYRHGIEEALAFLSVIFLCCGMASALRINIIFGVDTWLTAAVPATGAVASFFIYRRFGYLYAILAMLVCLALIPSYLVVSPEICRFFLYGIYLIGLVVVRSVRDAHRQDYLNEEYGTIEAMLWLALYLTLNLQLTSINIWARWRMSGAFLPNLSRPFYWSTYVLIWLLPSLAIRQALKQKCKPLLGVGIIMALLTFVTNKPYLGWPRHEWDAMLLGAFLVGLVIAIRNWLAKGSNGVRAGLTARRLSGSDKRFLSVLGSASGLIQGVSPGGGTSKTDFGGGRSGGGGASSNY